MATALHKAANCLVMRLTHLSLIKCTRMWLRTITKTLNIWNIDAIIENFYAINTSSAYSSQNNSSFSKSLPNKPPKLASRNHKYELKKIRVLIYVMAGKFCHQLYLILTGRRFNSNFQFINFDFIKLAQMHEDLNLIMLIFCLETGLMLHYLYSQRKNSKFFNSILLMRSVLSSEGQPLRFRYFNMQLNYNRIRQEVNRVIQAHNWLLRQFSVAVVAFIIIAQGIMACHLIGNSDYYLGSWSGLAEAALMQTNGLITIVMICTYCQVNYIASTVMLSFSWFCFVTLKQINAQLDTVAREQRTVLDLMRNKLRFLQFFRNHTRMLLLILNFDNVMGTLLFGFIAINIPLNSYLTLSILSGAYNPQTVLYICPFLAQQYIVNVGFHCLGALYTERIHKCCRRLFRFVGTVKTSPYQDFKDVLRLNGYIQKFNTVNPYGITYAGIALIKLHTFVEFWAFYFQFLMYWYRIIFHIQF